MIKNLENMGRVVATLVIVTVGCTSLGCSGPEEGSGVDAGEGMEVGVIEDAGRSDAESDSLPDAADTGRDDLAEGPWNPDDYFMTSEIGPVPEYEQRPGDPEKGYDILVNEGYVSCGLPDRLYTEYFSALAGNAPKIEGRRAINADLPYDRTRFERDGIEIVSTNCLACHANINPATGELMIGLGNEGDYTQNLGRAAELGAGLVNRDDPRESEEYDRFASRMMTVTPYIRTHTSGVNPADNLAGILTAHRDPDTWEWLEEPWYELPDVPVLPLSVPPLWNVAKKNALYYTSVGRGDHARFMMAAALLCTDSEEEARQIDEWFVHVRAYLETLEPPEYPEAVDESLAADGKAVFDDNCARCHGTYGPDGEYPNLVVSLEEVGTDPTLASAGVLTAKEAVSWLNRSFFGEVSIVASAPGYVAPPLDGVWATGPYFHNASVPTIEAVLDSSKRPQFWRRSYGGYDFDRLGVWYSVSEYGKDGAENDTERRSIYDTRELGYGNGGHTFGDDLTSQERSAVLEYVKTL